MKENIMIYSVVEKDNWSLPASNDDDNTYDSVKSRQNMSVFLIIKTPT